jgi:hypothetical protein
MKIAHINEQNKLLGWYDTEIHSTIPIPNIEVTDEVWQNAINNNHNKVNLDGTTENYDFRSPEEIVVEELQNRMSKKITPRQARLILLKYELLDDIEAMIITDRALSIWWEYSTEIERSNPQLLVACSSLGITSEQLDAMFLEASTL